MAPQFPEPIGTGPMPSNNRDVGGKYQTMGRGNLNTLQTIDPMQITFFDECEERWNRMG